MATAIIVAGGSGVRMNAAVRKQYMPIGNLPILCRTIMSFASSKKIEDIVLVVPENESEYCRRHILSLLDSGLQERITLTPGGKERQASVYNGLLAVGDVEGIVCIHDGVRPFVLPLQIDACIESAEKHGAAILATPASDTLKKIDNNGRIVKTPARENIWLAQTPQVFRYDLIRDAHERALKDNFMGTDDASLVERLGGIVKICPGSRLNIKITTPEDLQLAEAFLAHGLFERF